MTEITESIKLKVSESEIHEIIEEIKDKSSREVALMILEERKKAENDVLTGLSNRRVWEEEVKRFAAHTERTEEPLTVALIDIDNLKTTNDTLGHDIGDQLIIFVAEALKATGIRESDTIARIGGDEFACLFPNANLEGAKLFTERFRTEIDKKRKNFAEGVGLPENVVDVSIGLSQREAKEKIEITIKRADDNLYVEKDIKKSNYGKK